MPARLDIPLQRNEGWARSLFLTDNDGIPIDLTDMTAAMEIRDKLTQSLITSARVVMVDPVRGEILVEIRGGFGSALGSYGDPIQTANLHHDMRLTDANGASVVLFSGIIILSRGETRA